MRKISYVILVHHARKGAAHDAPVKRRSDLPNFTPAATPILYLRRNSQQLQLGIEHRAAQETNRLLLALKTNPPVLALEALDSLPAAPAIQPSYLQRIEQILAKPQRHSRKSAARLHAGTVMSAAIQMRFLVLKPTAAIPRGR